MRGLLRDIAVRLSFLKPILEGLVSLEASVAEGWVSGAHKRLYLVQWGMKPKPEFFCHKIDLYRIWKQTRASHWLERGVYSTLAINPGASALELGCGDGFNAYMFYSKKAEKVLAIDIDPRPLHYAKRTFACPNIEYRLADMKTQMPEGDYDNIIWDAVFAYFTDREVDRILLQIKDRLSACRGTLSGTTQVRRADGRKHSTGHVYECSSKEDLLRFLSPYFVNVTVFETVHPDRHNLYFWASDGTLPFGKEWPLFTRSRDGQVI